MQKQAERSKEVWPLAVRLGALAGVAAPVLAALIAVIAAAIRPGYSPVSQYLSDLSLGGPHAWLQTANFIVLGLLLIGFAGALNRSMVQAAGSGLGPGLVAVYGFGWVLAGVFHGQMHWLATWLFIALPLACFAMLPRLARDPRWRGYVAFTIVCGIVGLAFSTGWYVHQISTMIPHLVSWIGLYQRVFYGVLLLWVEVIALRLARLSLARPVGLPSSERLTDSAW